MTPLCELVKKHTQTKRITFYKMSSSERTSSGQSDIHSTPVRGKDFRSTIDGESNSLPASRPLSRKLDQLSLGDQKIGSMVTPDTSRMSPVNGGSPVTSQVSVGSVGGSAVAALLPKHYDLTPVMRNTSHEYVEDAKGKKDRSRMVSPDDHDMLHGEHLALPSGLGSHEAGPSMPGLRTDRKSGLGEPIQFPSRKFYTFTSREQYEDSIFHAHEYQPSGLIQYQPDRDDDFRDIGILNDEGLQQIFAIRGEQSSDTGAIHRRLDLQEASSMGERQLSIPSIHLAYSMHGSIASYTECDDEESLQFLRDDGSLSSRGSSLYLPDHDEQPGSVLSLGPSQRGAVVLEELHRVVKEKKPKPMEWLQSMEADQGQVAEAASSKLLRRHATEEVPQRRQTMPPVFTSSDTRIQTP